LENGYWKYIDEFSGEVSVFYKNELRYYKLMVRNHSKKYPCVYVKIDGGREIAAMISILKRSNFWLPMTLFIFTLTKTYNVWS
jgi:hypothetical protein